MSLAEYLAKNYLTADSKPEKLSKKRKRKDAKAGGLIIADDDSLGWNSNGAARDDEDGPLTVGANSAEFRKSKSNNWKIIGAKAPSSSDQAAADAIIASAAAESNARKLEDEDAPAVDGTVKMESGAHAGLQTADQVTAQLKRKQAEERQRFLEDGDEVSGRGKETIYRDASGRIINVAMKRAEARKKAEEEAAKAAAELEAQKGDVQRADRAKRKEQLNEAKFMPVARYADDLDMNEELKERERWNDPASEFLAKKKQGKSVSGKPLYTGPSMPNRYGIRPGHRWDGVDRGNGFEKEYFAAQNRRRNLKDLDYAWQMDE
ncbi:Pre-mRNA-splicing factor cwc26 [Toensbergia leucococca]|nr:Pre-mRNA-splicing factor cwc26 [Toensbergia leucococca]